MYKQKLFMSAVILFVIVHNMCLIGSNLTRQEKKLQKRRQGSWKKGEIRETSDEKLTIERKERNEKFAQRRRINTQKTSSDEIEIIEKKIESLENTSIKSFLSDRYKNLTREAIIPMVAGVGTMTALHYGTKHYCPEATDLHKITGSMVKSSGVAAVILAATYKQEDRDGYEKDGTFAETARNTIRVLAPGVVGAGTELIIQSQPVQDAIDTIENKLPESFVRVTKPVVEHLGKPVFDWFVATQIINFLNFLTSGPTDSTGSNS